MLLDEHGNPIKVEEPTDDNEGNVFLNVERGRGVIWLQLGVQHPEVDDSMALMYAISMYTRMGVGVFGPTIVADIIQEAFDGTEPEG